MKERDITELLVDLPFRRGRYFRPFVVLPTPSLEAKDEESGPGYLVWLGLCQSPEEARKLAALPRPSVDQAQTIADFYELPSTRYSLPGGESAIIYDAVPAIAGPHAELLIGRIMDGLYLWGVNNPR